MQQLIWSNAHEMQQLIWNYAHEIIKQITRGAVIRDQVAKRMEGKAEKMAMTVELMYKLKISLLDSRFSKSRRRIIWVSSTLCWSGALRVHEILARETTKFEFGAMHMRGSS